MRKSLELEKRISQFETVKIFAWKITSHCSNRDVFYAIHRDKKKTNHRKITSKRDKEKQLQPKRKTVTTRNHQRRNAYVELTSVEGIRE